MKCQLCGKTTTRLYPVQFAEDMGINSTVKVCADCVPEECVDYIEKDGQETMNSLLNRRR